MHKIKILPSKLSNSKKKVNQNDGLLHDGKSKPESFQNLLKNFKPKLALKKKKIICINTVTHVIKFQFLLTAYIIYFLNVIWGVGRGYINAKQVWKLFFCWPSIQMLLLYIRRVVNVVSKQANETGDIFFILLRGWGSE